MHCILLPAYGRDYKSKAEVLVDFIANKDFILVDMQSKYDGKPCNKSSLIEAGYKTVSIRYKNKTQVMVVNL